jgi:hypothetical protein
MHVAVNCRIYPYAACLLQDLLALSLVLVRRTKVMITMQFSNVKWIKIALGDNATGEQDVLLKRLRLKQPLFAHSSESNNRKEKPLKRFFLNKYERVEQELKALLFFLWVYALIS